LLFQGLEFHSAPDSHLFEPPPAAQKDLYGRAFFYTVPQKVCLNRGKAAAAVEIPAHYFLAFSISLLRQSL